MNKELIAGLQAKLWDSLAKAVPNRTSRYAIVDFPNHSNIGDSAIYVGEEILLSQYFGGEPLIVTEAFDQDIADLSRLSNGIDVIFLHGGGNFGDLWPRHQIFREAVISRFPNHKIVQLPQTLFYKDRNNLERSAAVINKHPDFTLMVRDVKSQRMAENAFSCPILLTPDMALMIGAKQAPIKPRYAFLALIRDDQESKFNTAPDLTSLAGSSVILDWPAEQKRRPLSDRVKAKFFKARPVEKIPSYYKSLAQGRLDKGFNLLAQGGFVITDRLHAHILSLLLDKPHVVLDNHYGKISTFIEAWTDGGRFDTAGDIETAIRLANDHSDK